MISHCGYDLRRKGGDPLVVQKDRGVKFVFKLARNLPPHSFSAQKWFSSLRNIFVTKFFVIFYKVQYLNFHTKNFVVQVAVKFPGFFLPPRNLLLYLVYENVIGCCHI